MWHTKKWKLNEVDKYNAWLERNTGHFEIVVLFVNNGYAVQWRKLRTI